MEANPQAVEAGKEARKEALVVIVLAAMVHQKPNLVVVAWAKTEVVLAEHRELQEPPMEEAER